MTFIKINIPYQCIKFKSNYKDIPNIKIKNNLNTTYYNISVQHHRLINANSLFIFCY
jgi:hypothetical protein